MAIIYGFKKEMVDNTFNSSLLLIISLLLITVWFDDLKSRYYPALSRGLQKLILLNSVQMHGNL